MKTKIYRMNCTTHGEWRTTAITSAPYVAWSAEATAQLSCPACGMSGRYIGNGITVTNGRKPCDDSCRFAKSDTCACACKGEYHGLRIPVGAA